MDCHFAPWLQVGHSRRVGVAIRLERAKQGDGRELRGSAVSLGESRTRTDILDFLNTMAGGR